MDKLARIYNDAGRFVFRAPHGFTAGSALGRMAALSVFFCALCIALLAGAPDALAARGARAAILINMDTGKVLFEKNADMSIPPASLTKVMSMFLTMTL